MLGEVDLDGVQPALQVQYRRCVEVLRDHPEWYIEETIHQMYL
jgi:hypothetical protein